MRLFVVLWLLWIRPGQLMEFFGSLESPHFPNPYPPDLDRSWNLSVPEGFRVKLVFSHFDLEPSYQCQYDSVQVEADGQVLALYCGREETDTEAVPGQRVITSPRTSLCVRFTSDFSNEERHSGFMAHYSAVDVDECSERSDRVWSCDHFCHNYIGGYYCSCRYGYLLHTDNHTCKVECSSDVFRERSGVLSSVDFPSPYPKSSDCSYHIQLEDGFRLRLQFDPRFDVEDHPDIICPYDYVKIEAGSSQFGPFCGGQSPGVVQTDSNIVTVRFHSDDSGENLGWRLTYTSTGSQCPVPETPPHAVLNPVQSEYSFKDHIVITCEPGYRLLMEGQILDHYQLDCQANGSWSGLPPQCQTCGHPSRSLPSQVKRIVGGRSADPGLFPWQVLLSVEDLSRVPEDRWFGSGALLSESWVLTAAHVLRSQRRDASIVPVAPDHVKVFIGLQSIRDKHLSTNHSVDQILLHPDFHPNNYDNDVALLRLSRKVVFNQLVQPVCLPPASPQAYSPTLQPDSLGVVAGWGISSSNTSSSPTSDLGVTSDFLQYVRLPVVSQDECRESYASRSVSYNVTDNMFCAGFLEGGQDTCLGDSGGAFVMQVRQRWVVLGLVSWAGPEDCGSHRVYGVYTRVERYVGWIQSYTHNAPWW